MSLYSRISMALSDAQSSTEVLVEIASIQNSSLIIQSSTEALLPNLEDLSAEVRNRLMSISLEVPASVERATRSLEEVSKLSPLQLDLNSTQGSLEMLQRDVQEADTSNGVVSSTLTRYGEEYAQLNLSLSSLLEESKRLDKDAEFLLERARRYLNLGQTSRDESNAIIKEVQSLLDALRNSTSDQDRLVQGLGSVIRNVELAEMEVSRVAREVGSERSNLRTLEGDIETAVGTLERAASNLQEALNVSQWLCI